MIALGLGVGLALMPAAEAVCPGYIMGQVYYSPAYDAFTILGDDATTNLSNMTGRFWRPGDRAAANEGTFTIPGWFTQRSDRANNSWQFNINTGDGGVVGCSPDDYIVLVQAQTTDGKSHKIVVGRQTAHFEDATVWNFTSWRGFTDMPAVEVANPGVTLVNKAGSVVTYNLTFPNLTQAFQGYSGAPNAITGYQLVRSAAAGVPSGVDVGRSPAAWTAVGSPVAPGGSLTNQTFDCSTLAAGQDLFLAVRVVYDNGQVLGDYVGKSTQVKCNSTQVDPKFRKIDKKNL